MGFKAILAVCAAAAITTAGGSGPAIAQTQPSVQQHFEAATAALDSEKWDEALRIFEGLEQRLAKSPRSLGIVRVRKAEALIGLGRPEEAEQAIRLGLPSLPVDDVSLKGDRYLAHLALGQVAERALDYGGAIQQYRIANGLASDIRTRKRAVRGLIQTGMFYDAPGALAEADRALVAAQETAPGEKTLEALFRTLRGRVLLNLGRFEEAENDLHRATQLLGGLTYKADAGDISARSDLAIAALLAGNAEKARKYLAWTGAGRMGAFPRAHDMAPPPCGDELEPGDVAVVEFSILEDGSILRATPIYSSRQGPSALAFARAITEWSFRPDELAEIPLLFRLLTRVEVRCSTALKRPSLNEILGSDVDAWLSERGQTIAMDGMSDASLLEPLKTELARREAAGRDSLGVLPVLRALAINDLVSAEDREDYLTRGALIARANKAPAPVIGWFQILAAGHQKKADRALRALLADPEISADPRTMAAVRLSLADHLYYKRAGNKEEALAVLKPLEEASGLDKQDAVRAAGLVRIASLELAIGRPDAARAAFDASGLSADQCALLDRAPRMNQSGASNTDFPQEALKWGFEGWAHQEFDIDAKGRSKNVRTIVAYPPFVFGKAASDVIETSKFDVSFRPGGGLGCGGLNLPVNFQVR
jgi:tetratricopeptide (TPR) repeat protein